MSFLEVTSFLLDGFKISLLIFGVTLLLGAPLGLPIAFGSMSKFKPVKYTFKVIVWIVRGIPLMLQIFIIYYLPGLLFNFQLFGQVDRFFLIEYGIMDAGRIMAVLIAFTFNYACYFSEIYRGGIQSISKGQYEAGQVLGMTKTQIFFKVVFLQVVKRIIPPMSNEIITLIKDTALANFISVLDMLYWAKTFMLKGLIWPLFYAGGFYLVFVGILTILFGKLEKKLSYFKA